MNGPFELSIKDDIRFPFLGNITILWNPERLGIIGEAEYTEYNYSSCPIVTQFEFVREFIHHARDLILHSEENLLRGLQTLHEPNLSEGYETIRYKINETQYDNFFDPLCALELRNALGELVQRKADLLNICRKTLEAMKWVEEEAELVHRFANQLYIGDTKGGPRHKGIRRFFCCAPKFITYEELVESLGLGVNDSLETMAPLNPKFQRIL